MGVKRILHRVICIFLIGGILMFCFFGCGKKGNAVKYQVDYNGQKSSFENAKDSYKAGEKVTLYYKYIATDTDYAFYLDSERLNTGYDDDKGFIISFEMPAHDVTLTVEQRNLMVTDDPYTTEKQFEKEAKLSFHSFDGGGPEYSIKIDDPSVVSCTSKRDYGKKNHEVIDGAAYDVIFKFKGLKSGTTDITVHSSSPIMDDEEYRYLVEVNDDLKINIEELPTENEPTEVEESEPEA
ncbi:MAG: hypothetical protein K5756_05810 [Clostridiales bacterium]|nr:hypothetical protein [Clostridiales bacterium]